MQVAPTRAAHNPRRKPEVAQIAQEAVEESRSECGGVRKVPLAVAIFSADLLLCGASPRAPVIAYVLLTGRASDSDRPTIARIHCPSGGPLRRDSIIISLSCQAGLTTTAD